MRKIIAQLGSAIVWIESRLSLIVLVALLLFTYAKFAEHPYQGFRTSSNGQVIRVYSSPSDGPTLLEKDIILQIGDTTWKSFQSNLRQPYFEVIADKTVQILVQRHGEEKPITVDWTFPGQNQDELTDLLFNEGWLSFVFWFAGTMTALSLRPKNKLWRLMLWFNYLTALWLAVGSGLSFYHIWDAAVLLRSLVWIAQPVYLHLHWVYPEPFKKQLAAPLIWGGYLMAFALAIGEWFNLVPHGLYFLCFFGVILGSVVLLIFHAAQQPSARRDLRLVLFVVALMAFFPALLMFIFSIFGSLNFLMGAGTIGLPFLSFVYFYTVARRQLGELEVRANKLISGYLFLVVLAVLFFCAVPIINVVVNKPGEPVIFSGITIAFSLIVSVIAVGLTVWLFPAFQGFVERRLLRIKLPSAQLQEIYSSRITTSTSMSALQKLITSDLLPTFSVREFMFVQFEENNESPQIFFAVGIAEDFAPHLTDIPTLLSTAGTYRPLSLLPENERCRWVRLALPLKIGEKLTGFWLFGRRDPDDGYSQAEIPTLKSLANQTAVAQSNIQQTDRLKALSLINIDRYENERRSLTLELHDGVLNRIAALTMSLDVPLPESFHENYEKLTQEVREIITNLRPPMLSFGLKLAIQELVEYLSESPKTTAKITLDISTVEDGRYEPNIEQHLYRIVQEACSNAIRHANAKNIRITGRLDLHEITLKIEDDGTGFQVGANLDKLLANKHFGLVGMRERAEIIGATFDIKSTPSIGTQILVLWRDSVAKA